MSTQEDRWRREFEEWLRGGGLRESLNFTTTDFAEAGYLAAAQKYSPSDAEREYLEAAYEVETLTRLESETYGDCGEVRRKCDAADDRYQAAYQALHAERTPPKVDHLGEAMRLLQRWRWYHEDENVRDAFNHIKAAKESQE